MTGRIVAVAVAMVGHEWSQRGGEGGMDLCGHDQPRVVHVHPSYTQWVDLPASDQMIVVWRILPPM